MGGCVQAAFVSRLRESGKRSVHRRSGSAISRGASVNSRAAETAGRDRAAAAARGRAQAAPHRPAAPRPATRGPAGWSCSRRSAPRSGHRQPVDLAAHRARLPRDLQAPMTATSAREPGANSGAKSASSRTAIDLAQAPASCRRPASRRPPARDSAPPRQRACPAPGRAASAAACASPGRARWRSRARLAIQHRRAAEITGSRHPRSAPRRRTATAAAAVPRRAAGPSNSSAASGIGGERLPAGVLVGSDGGHFGSRGSDAPVSPVTGCGSSSRSRRRRPAPGRRSHARSPGSAARLPW